MESWVQPPPRSVLSVGLSQPLESAGLEGVRMVHAENAPEALRTLVEEDVGVLVLGPRLASREALAILAHCASELPVDPPAVVVLCACAEPELFQRFIDEGLIFYLARGEIKPEQLRSLVVCGASHLPAKTKREQDPLSGSAPYADRLLDLCVRLPMQKDVSNAGGLLAETVRDVIQAAYVQCLVYDPDEATLTSTDAEEGREWSYSAASGLAAFVARTGKPVHLDRVGADPCYDSDIDNPQGTDSARFIAQPIVGSGGLPAGVILAVRSGESAPFSVEELRLLEFIAECAAPTFGQILLQNRVQAALTGRAAGAESNSGVFRQEALEYHIRSWDQQGDVLKTLPPWLRSAYWAVLALVLVGLIGLAWFIPGVRNLFGKVN